LREKSDVSNVAPSGVSYQAFLFEIRLLQCGGKIMVKLF
jgi:hypothetical protein